MSTLESLALGFIIIVSLILLWLESKKRREKDLATRARNEKLVEEIRQRYHTSSQDLLDVLQDAVFAVSLEGKILRANEKTNQLFAHRALEGRFLEEALLYQEIIAPIRESITQKKALSQKITLPKVALPSIHAGYLSESHWLLESFLVPPAGDELHFLIVMRDISENVRTEQIRKDFVANASHELRTPLTIIGGYLENLMEDELIDDPEQSKHALVIMQKHVERINRIVEDMLVISRLESGETAALNYSVFKVVDCLHDVLERLEPLISKQNAQITLVPKNSQLEIEADHFYWTQVFFNLIENALKQNSTIPVNIFITIGSNEENELVLAISDNGKGIHHDDIPYIFNRFFRSEKHHSQNRVKGTGLGLSIVRRAIEAHQGTVSCHSSPGVETIFKIVAPLKKPR